MITDVPDDLLKVVDMMRDDCIIWDWHADTKHLIAKGLVVTHQLRKLVDIQYPVYFYVVKGGLHFFVVGDAA